mgnify:FL=1
MNFIDLLIIAIIGFGIIRGFTKGLIIELSSFFGIFISFLIAGNLDDLMSKEILEFLKINIDIVNTISFIIVFILSYLVIIMIAKGFTKLAKIIYLGFLNSLMGAIFGGLKVILILLIITKILFSLNISTESFFYDSSLIIYLHILSEVLFDFFEISKEVYQDNLV